MIYYGNELYHHGIKGQKWGERNYQNQDGSWTPLGKKRRREENYSDDYKKVHDGKSYKELSTSELKDRNYRLSQENNYRENLRKQEEKTRSQKMLEMGKKIVKAFTGVASVLTAAYAAYKTYSKFANKAVDKMGNYVVSDLKAHPFRL